MENRRALLKEQWNKVATFFKTKDVVTFLLFVVLAAVLWLMHSTSSQREMRSTAKIQYTGIPEYVELNEALPRKIEYKVKDESKQLWSYFSYSFDTLTIDLSGAFASGGDKVEIEYETHLHKMISQFSPTSKIVELTPSVFSTTYVTLKTKTVPVRLSNAIHISAQHVLTDSIEIVPGEVTIIGEQKRLDEISEVRVKAIHETFTKSQSIRCDVVVPEGVKADVGTVSVVVPIEMSTEKRMTLPVVVVNAPEGVEVKTFPSEVDVVFTTGLSKYNQIGEKDIMIALDYKDIMANPNVAQRVRVERKSPEVNNLRVSPQVVEYIIEKR